MKLPKGIVSSALLKHASRLRFPYLFGITAALFLLDLIVPDMLPFADELLLGLLTILLGGLKKNPRQNNRP